MYRLPLPGHGRPIQYRRNAPTGSQFLPSFAPAVRGWVEATERGGPPPLLGLSPGLCGPGGTVAYFTHRTVNREQVLEMEVLNLNEEVATLGKRLRCFIGEDIGLAISLASSLGRVKADPTQIHQIPLNLAANARQAMPNGGTLRIDTAKGTLDEDYAVRQFNRTEQSDYG